MGTQVTKRKETDDQALPAFDTDKTTLRENLDATRVNAPVSPASEAQTELSPGAVLKDRFEIVSVLGRGGMGVVYRAIDRRKVEAQDRDPHVALKALSQSWQRDERMVIALQREARKAQTLAHPNIATVYDFDRDGDFVYITMEQLSGQPLDEVIRAHPKGLPVRQVRPIVRGLCNALAYAHNKGIVHSDFKPGNVFLHEGTHPKVLDFGIARATPVVGESAASSQTQFDAGDLGALTPSYAAVEMFQGAPPHPADDVYALAITVYQLLTGRHPFDNLPAPQARSAGRKPEPIRGIRRREWQAIRRGLEYDRKDRIGHAHDFLRAFEGRRNTVLAASAAVLLALTLGGYYGYVQWEDMKRTAPEITFTDLPEQTQAAVLSALSEGDLSREYDDHAGALAAYRSAYALHPRNSEATERLLGLLETLATDQAAGADARAALADNIDDIMATDAFLGAHPRLRTLRDTLEISR